MQSMNAGEYRAVSLVVERLGDFAFWAMDEETVKAMDWTLSL
jgi:hypothetical protein